MPFACSVLLTTDDFVSLKISATDSRVSSWLKLYARVTHFSCFHLSAPLPSYSVLVATKKSIWQLFMDTKQNQATFRKLQIGYNPSMLVALDYNPVDKRVYWSDVEENSIYRMPVSGVGGMESLFRYVVHN